MLGIVQGLTEFLPVSSTAHLRIVPAFVGWDDPGAAFTAVVQLGTMAAVLLYFRADLWRIVTTWLRSLRDPELRGDLDARMGWYIGLGTIPIAIFGFIFRDQIESGGRNLYLIGVRADRARPRAAATPTARARRDRDLASFGPRDAAVMGFAQALALVPGVSRSGATITGGLFRGFDRESAARYSFLLSVPAVVLSGLFEARKIGGEGSAARRADDPRHDPGVRRRLRLDRLDAALPGTPLDRRSSWPTASCWARSCWCSPPRAPSRSLPFTHGRPRARPPAAVRLPPAGRAHPRRLLLGRLLQPDARSCWRPTATTRAWSCRSSSARSRSSAASTRRSPCSSSAPATTRATAGSTASIGSRSTRCTRATRSRRGRR